MSRFDESRLGADVFKLDAERMRRGWYSDRYFVNIQRILATLADRDERYSGSDPMALPPGIDPHSVRVGDLEVEMQWFSRRQPGTLVCGVDKALAMLALCTGYHDAGGTWVNTSQHLEVQAVHDGDYACYGGDPSRVTPAMRVRGRYRDFAHLETPTLGALSRSSRVATNVYEILAAAAGKSVLFFPARFDAHEIQAMDGYAYHIAVQRYAEDHPKRATSSKVSTDAQGDWWGAEGGGTVAHAAIACFLGDSPASMVAFAEIVDPAIPRIALVDFRNDCMRDTLLIMDALWPRYLRARQDGDEEQASRYRLVGVRPDTSASVRDASVQPTGDPSQDNGVNPRLVRTLRAATDDAWRRWEVPPGWEEEAASYCRNVGIVATGGFSPEKIRKFEAEGVPVDVYGVGSWCFRNDTATNTDFTADVVRVKVGGQWVDLAKAGRAPGDNPDLQRVQFPI
ncbi:MAG TPA: nicotinate phosphoribosyltransferase [Armatimonadota bacterium]|jgi:nicotinate phosphoribosyltransferase